MMISAAAVLPGILAVASGGYHAVAALCALGFARRVRAVRCDPQGQWPAVACLKPLCGSEPGAEQNLQSFLVQDYPGPCEVVFGTAGPQDSALEAARRACEQHPGLPSRVVCGERGSGTNRKIRNLRNIEAQASPDAEVLVLSDADIRVPPDYAMRMVAPLKRDPSAGASTALYRIEGVSGSGGLLEALSVEAGFVPGVLVVAAFAGLRCAFGASIALRRTDFERAGGLQAVEDFLADDYKIGNNMAAAGRRVVLAPCVVSAAPPAQTFRRAWVHLLRWNRTIRVCQPAGYFFSILGSAGLWALAAAPFVGLVPFAAACLNRIISAAVVAACIGSRGGLYRAALAPLWDVLCVPLWLGGLFGRRVLWRNVVYRLRPDGRMYECTQR